MQHIQRFPNPIGSQSLNDYVWRILFLLIVMTSLLSSNVAFSADSPFKPTTPPDSLNGMCPSGHKIYSISDTGPTDSKTSISAWISGSAKKDFTFEESSGDKIFSIAFPTIEDKTSITTSTPANAISPFYGTISGGTSNAINLVHSSPVSDKSRTNHILNISVNRNVSKMGYKIQDLDSLSSNNITSYVEQVDVSAQGGKLTHNQTTHTVNPNGNIVTAIPGKNCGTGQGTIGSTCNIDASWNYNTAKTLVSLKHNNTMSQSNNAHAVAYSNFYFCLAPPKLIVKKQLNDIRVNDNDQFEIKVTGADMANNSFTTTGTGKTINNGSSSVISLAESTSYKVTESVVNGTIGDIENYNAIYECNNATDGSTTAMPTATMQYDATAKTRSFTLANLTYGDEITCIISNTPKDYTFSGTVFNDNGGIPANENTKQNITATFISNLEYFNGKLDASESGIYDSALSIRLTDCIGNDGGTNIVTSSPNPQTVSNTIKGNYIFNVKPSAIAGKRVCVVESEPASWKDKFYSVDTTANNREVIFATNTYSYGSLDFGEVEANNTALVLIKSQYIHDCNSNLNYANVGDKEIPTNGFSINLPATNIEPGKCIAYKIEAYNRGHVALSNVRITDILQKTPIESKFHLPRFSGTNSILRKTNDINSNSVAIGENGVIITEPFDLNNTSNTTPSKRTLYFNTKYGTTVDP